MYTAKQMMHNGQKRIAVYFEKKPELIARFKKLKGAKWSATLRVWHLPDTAVYREKFGITPVVVSKEGGKLRLPNALQRRQQTKIGKMS